MTDLPALPWDSISTVGLALIFTWMIATGRLVPRATVDRLLADGAQRTAYLERHMDAESGVKFELVTQNSKLLGTSQLATALLQAVAPSTPPRESHVVQGEG